MNKQEIKYIAFSAGISDDDMEKITKFAVSISDASMCPLSKVVHDLINIINSFKHVCGANNEAKLKERKNCEFNRATA